MHWKITPDARAHTHTLVTVHELAKIVAYFSYIIAIETSLNRRLRDNNFANNSRKFDNCSFNLTHVYTRGGKIGTTSTVAKRRAGWLVQGECHGKSSATVSCYASSITGAIKLYAIHYLSPTLPYCAISIRCQNTINAAANNKVRTDFWCFLFTICPTRPVNEHTMQTELQHRGEWISADVCVAIWLFWLSLIVQH